MAATETVQPFGRITIVADPPKFIYVCLSGNGASYATASGGLPIDLTTVLIQAAGGQGALNPSDQAYINPLDIVGFLPIGTSQNGFIASQFVLGTPTYTTAVGSGYGSAAGLPPAGTSQGFLTDQILVTCPATIRLRGTGSADHGGLDEVADGANTDVIYGFLVIATGGVNN
jgi:hypothetical protein